MASKLLKAEHPYIKIGGPAITSPWSDMMEPFFAYVKETGAPLDFFSWHGYLHMPGQIRGASEKVEACLNKYGFENTESIFDEWNYVVHWGDDIQKSLDLHTGPLCAAFMTSTMTVLQDSRTDKSFYYDAQFPGAIWNGLFERGKMLRHGEPRPIYKLKPFYALKAWHLLDELGEQVKAATDDADVFPTAACDGKTLRLLVTSYNDDAGFGESCPETKTFALDLGGVAVKDAIIQRIDAEHDFGEEPFDGKTFTLPGNSFALLTLTLA